MHSIYILKRIIHLLKGAMSKGLIMRSANDLLVDCYPDAAFAGLYEHEVSHNPHCS